MPEVELTRENFFGKHAEAADRVIFDLNVGLMARGLPRLRREGSKLYWDARMLEIIRTLREEGILTDKDELYGTATMDEAKRRWDAYMAMNVEVKLHGEPARRWLEERNLPIRESRVRYEREAPCMPVEMPELRVKLLALWQSVAGRVAAGIGAQRAVLLHGTAAQPPTEYTQWEVDALNRADLWWVGPDMCDLLYATMAKVPEDVTVLDLQVPSAYGLIVLAKPWVGIDSDTGEGSLYTSGVCWGPQRLIPGEDNPYPLVEGDVPALAISTYGDIDWAQGLSKSELGLAVRMGLHETAKRGTVMAQDGSLSFSLSGKEWMPLGRSDWPVQAPLNQGFLSADAPEELEGERYERFMASVRDDRRFIAALFTLLNTHSVAEMEERPAPRPVRRRLERAGHTQSSTVKVVYLRRPDREHGEHTEGSGSNVQWSHRWIVSAHMRNQPYGPGRAKRKLILIPAHVKGPSDLPVVVKETVKAWVR